MKLTIVGGGAWGTTLGQVCIDNGHDVLIYDVNKDHVEKNQSTNSPIF